MLDDRRYADQLPRNRHVQCSPQAVEVAVDGHRANAGFQPPLLEQVDIVFRYQAQRAGAEIDATKLVGLLLLAVRASARRGWRDAEIPRAALDRRPRGGLISDSVPGCGCDTLRCAISGQTHRTIGKDGAAARRHGQPFFA